MRQIVELRTRGGGKVTILLENWGSGLDDALRRWVMANDGWECTDTGDFAEEARLVGLKVFDAPRPVLGLR